MSQPWGLVLETPEGAALHKVVGSVVSSDHASVEDAIVAADLPSERLIVLGRAPATSLPARLLPDSLSDLGGVLQDAPMGWLSPGQRIMLAGVLHGRANWDGVICLAEGDATHWVHVSAGEIISFQGAATGRLITALGGTPEVCDTEALADTLSRPERLAGHLHSAALAGEAAAVTGHLIGAELAAMRPYWLGQDVLVVESVGLYAAALQAQGAMVSEIAPEAAWQDGMRTLGKNAGVSS
ncbi:2-dehydro-3-deoxygalactonokinase [Rhodobacteraceae bacterium KMM 6894]|nr:2-dehydro-3-deoxygalactonokinase [Rhodobacteraceae bacterium KMM 6894]